MQQLLSLAVLSEAVEYVSASEAAYGEGAAYLHLPTGRIYLVPAEDTGVLDDDFPEGDLEDETLFLLVPSWSDFDLGKSLVLRFVREHLPDDEREVRGHFARKGAYRRFTELLDRRDQREAWYTYRAAAQEEALAEWADEHGLQLGP